MKPSVLCLLIASVSSVPRAEQPTAKDLKGRIDLEVPQSAGFALLGVTPDKVIEPQSGKAFGMALLQGLDGKGNFQSGYALETRPYLWKQPAYASEPTPGKRFLSGFKLGFATTTGLEEKDKANRYGAGINWSYQFNDPLLNREYADCLNKGSKVVPLIPTDPDPSHRIPAPMPPIEARDTLATILKSLDSLRTEMEESKRRAAKADSLRSARLDSLRAEHGACKERHLSWNATALSAGAAGHRALEDERDLDESGFGVWATGSYAWGKWLEITAHFRLVNNLLALTDSLLRQSDQTVLAARLRFGGASIRGIAESSWNIEEAKGEENDFGLASAGLEFKLLEGLWFRASYGYTFASEEAKDSFTGQLRFGFGDKPLAKLD